MPGTCYRFDGFELDLELFELRGPDGARVPLERQVYEVLAYLVQNHQRVVPKDELLDQIWPERYVSEAALNSRLMSARKAIGDNGREQRLLRTLHGRGYRFIGDVHVAGNPVAHRASEPRTRPEVERSYLPGRSLEFAHLEEALERALGGKRQVVFFTGPAGFGKTSVVRAFLDSIRQQDLLIAQGQCIEQSGAGEAFLPFLDALSNAGKEDTSDVVWRLIRQLAPNWALQLPGVLQGGETELIRASTLGAQRARMFREALEVLDAIANERPLVLVLEDLHWSDPSSCELLAAIARRPNPARLLVVATYRPSGALAEHRPEIATLQQELRLRGLCTERALGSLDEAAVGDALRARLAASAVDEAAVRLLVKGSGGHPLFMSYLIEHLLETGALVKSEAGVLSLREGALDGDVPPNLREMVTMQVRQLPREHQEVLQVASLIGSQFEPSVVAEVLEFDDEEVDAICAALSEDGTFLQPAEVLEWTMDDSSDPYTFVHEFYRELVQSSVTRARKSRTHRRIAEVLEARSGAKLTRFASELARHSELGNEPRKAIRFRQMAAQQALGRSGYQEAETHLRQAIQLLQQSVDAGVLEESEALLLEMNLYAALGPTVIFLRGFADEDVEFILRRVLELALQAGDPSHQASAVLGLITVLEYRGAHHESEHLLDQFQGILGATSGSAQPFHALRSCAAFHRGLFGEAVEEGRQGLAANPDALHDTRWALFGEEPDNGCREWSSLALWFLGQSDAAVAQVEEAVRKARQPGHGYALASALSHAARVHQLRGEPQLARTYAQETLSVAQSYGFPYHTAVAHVMLGWALAREGSPGEGLQLLRRGIEEHAGTGATMDRPYFLGLFAEGLLAAGQDTEALVVARQSLELIGDEGFFYSAEIRRLVGVILTKVSPVDAEKSFLEAVELAREQGARGLELRAACSLAELWKDDQPAAVASLLQPLLERCGAACDRSDIGRAESLLTLCGAPPV